MSAASARPILGIDIGGTKLAAGVAAADGTLLAVARTPTHVVEGPDAIIERIVELARRVVAESGLSWGELAGAGIACGGPLDPAAGIVHDPPNLPGWHAIPLVARIRAALDIHDIYLENDANAAALAESRYGAGRGVRDLVYFTISTGIGGGAVLDGRLYHGTNGNAAEFGHMTVDHRGRRCPCGRRGCLEAYASGTAIAARAREALSAGEASSLAAVPGAPATLTAEDVVAAVRAGDRVAQALWDETTAVLGAGIANVIDAFDPRLVILGGGVTHAGDLLFEPVRRIALDQVFGPFLRVAGIVPAMLSDHTGVLGAVAVALERLAGEAPDPHQATEMAGAPMEVLSHA